MASDPIQKPMPIYPPAAPDAVTGQAIQYLYMLICEIRTDLNKLAKAMGVQ